MSSTSNREPLNLLSLDGGGVRGVSELVILDRIMRRIQDVKKLDYLPKPCDYFDLIAGTSTGGLVAILLGRLRMSTEEALKKYDEVAGVIFSDTNKKFRISNGFSSKFKASTLKGVVESIVRERGEDALMINPTRAGQKGKVFVCAAAGDKLDEIHRFRTYEAKDERTAWLSDCKIWEAARATTAAPVFFKGLEIARGSIEKNFVDAALGCNNPSEELLDEAGGVFNERRKLGCILSLGTGTRPNGILKAEDYGYIPSILKAMKNITTNPEKPHERLRTKFQNFEETYFRFNVPDGAVKVGLDEWKKMAELKDMTNKYLDQESVDQDIRSIAYVLAFKKSSGLTIGLAARLDKPQLLLDTTEARRMGNASTKFVGRRDILETLDACFAPRQTHHKRRRHFLLCGMGGAGKTQIALKFAETRGERFKYIFWVDAENLATASRSYKDIAIADMPDGFKDDSPMKVVQDWISSLTDEWLLILDNSTSEYIGEIVPPGNRGNIIYTSRHRGLGLSLPQSSIAVIEDLAFQDAVTLLLDAAEEIPYSTHLREQAAPIAKELGCLALALDQAGSYISKMGCSLPEYLELFRNRREILLKNERFKGADPRNQTVYATFDISYQAVVELARDQEGRTEGDDARTALDILSIICFYHNEGVHNEIFNRAAVNRHKAAKNRDFAEELLKEESRKRDARLERAQKSFREGGLNQSTLKRQDDPGQDRSHDAEEPSAINENSFKGKHTAEGLRSHGEENWRSINKDLTKGLGRSGKSGDQHNEEMPSNHDLCLRLLSDSGKNVSHNKEKLPPEYGECLRLLSDASNLRRASNSIIRRDSRRDPMNRWKFVQFVAPNGQLSKGAFSRLLMVDDKGEWKSETYCYGVILLEQFSLVNMDGGRQSVSIHVLTHVWARDRMSDDQRIECGLAAAEILVATSPYVSDPGTNHIWFLRKIAPHIKALQSFFKLSPLPSTSTPADPDDPKNLLKRYPKSEYEYNDPDMQSDLEFGLGYLIQSTGDLVTAEYLYKKGIDAIQWPQLCTLPTLAAKLMLARLYAEQDRYAEAEELLLEIYERSQPRPGKGTEITIEAMYELVCVYLDQFRPDAVETTWRRIIAMKERLGGHWTLNIARDVEKLQRAINIGNADSYSAPCRLEQAEMQVEYLTQQHDGVHRLTLSAKKQLALRLAEKQQQRYEEAQTLIEETLTSSIALLGLEHKDTLDARVTKARVLDLSNRSIEAEALLREVLADYQRLYGPRDLDTLDCLYHLGNAILSQGRYDEGLLLKDKVTELRAVKLGSDHAYVVNGRESSQASHQHARSADPDERRTLGRRALDAFDGREHTLEEVDAWTSRKHFRCAAVEHTNRQPELVYLTQEEINRPNRFPNLFETPIEQKLHATVEAVEVTTHTPDITLGVSQAGVKYGK